MLKFYLEKKKTHRCGAEGVEGAKLPPPIYFFKKLLYILQY
jgi:hypothetical protein